MLKLVLQFRSGLNYCLINASVTLPDITSILYFIYMGHVNMKIINNSEATMRSPIQSSHNKYFLTKKINLEKSIPDWCA